MHFNTIGSAHRTGRTTHSHRTRSGSTAFGNHLERAMGQQAVAATGRTGLQPQTLPVGYGGTEYIGWQPKSMNGKYSVQQVGQTNRAPMAMFSRGDELITSIISRNGTSKSSVYSYDSTGGLQLRGQLPDDVESGNYGFTAEDGVHIVAEAWNGMVEYVAPTPDGPWVKHDLTSLNPHEYKNLKWGFGFHSPTTGNQYLGFGNDRHPGVVLSRKNGTWQPLAAPEDMLFPTSMGEINDGVNAGTRLICSSTYGETRLHAVDANGNTRKLAEFDGWSYMTADPINRVAYVASESGQVFWSAFDDLENWQQATYLDKDGNTLDNIGRAGEINIHPTSGQVILPAADSGWIGNNTPTTEMGTNLYAASMVNGAPVFRQIDRIEGAGLWELRTAAVGNDLYLGTGLVSNQQQDAAPGGLYRIGTNSEGLDGLRAPLNIHPMATAPLTATSNSKDAVPTQQIQWVAGRDAANWPVQTDLTVDFKGSSLLFNHNAPWQRTIELDGESLAGNFWIGTRNKEGRWQMCPFEWFRKDQEQCRTGAATESGHLLGGMQPPRSGDEVLFMVSTPVRGGQRTDNQRSRIISARWP